MSDFLWNFVQKEKFRMKIYPEMFRPKWSLLNRSQDGSDDHDDDVEEDARPLEGVPLQQACIKQGLETIL
jgi:hypothetical protein